jgi:5,6-dimethylbenzimidazole synthase
MEIYEAIEKRRTVRSFKKGATEEQLRRVILAGSKAPSGGNSQPWEFIIVDDSQIINRLGELKYQISRTFTPKAGQTQEDVEEQALNQKRGFQNAAAVAVCTTKGQSSGGWMAVENMSLAAVAEGLGSNIVTYWGDAKKEVEKLIGLAEAYELRCVLKLGVAEAEVMPPERQPEFSWLHKNKL